MTLTALSSTIRQDEVMNVNRKLIRMLIAAIVLLVGYLSQTLAPEEDSLLVEATVARHIDGDTLVVELDDGTRETVRLIGVDTPEIDGPYTEAEPFGEEASRFTEQALPPGTLIYLAMDESDRDRHDRLLRYLWLSPVEDRSADDQVRSQLFNAILIAEGYAEARTYEPDTAYDQLFQQLEQEARENGIGIHQ